MATPDRPGDVPPHEKLPRQPRADAPKPAVPRLADRPDNLSPLWQRVFSQTQEPPLIYSTHEAGDVEHALRIGDTPSQDAAPVTAAAAPADGQNESPTLAAPPDAAEPLAREQTARPPDHAQERDAEQTEKAGDQRTQLASAGDRVSHQDSESVSPHGPVVVDDPDPDDDAYAPRQQTTQGFQGERQLLRPTGVPKVPPSHDPEADTAAPVDVFKEPTRASGASELPDVEVRVGIDEADNEKDAFTARFEKIFERVKASTTDDTPSGIKKMTVIPYEHEGEAGSETATARVSVDLATDDHIKLHYQDFKEDDEKKRSESLFLSRVNGTIRVGRYIHSYDKNLSTDEDPGRLINVSSGHPEDIAEVIGAFEVVTGIRSLQKEEQVKITLGERPPRGEGETDRFRQVFDAVMEASETGSLPSVTPYGLDGQQVDPDERQAEITLTSDPSDNSFYIIYDEDTDGTESTCDALFLSSRRGTITVKRTKCDFLNLDNGNIDTEDDTDQENIAQAMRVLEHVTGIAPLEPTERPKISIGEIEEEGDHMATFGAIFDEITTSEEHKRRNRIPVVTFNLDGKTYNGRNAFMRISTDYGAGKMIQYQENTDDDDEQITDIIFVRDIGGALAVSRLRADRNCVLVNVQRSTDPKDIAQAMHVLGHITGRIQPDEKREKITIGEEHEEREDYAVTFREMFEGILTSDDYRGHTPIETTPFNFEGDVGYLPKEKRAFIGAGRDPINGRDTIQYQEYTRTDSYAVLDKIFVSIETDGTLLVSRYRSELDPREESIATLILPDHLTLSTLDSKDPDDIAQAIDILKHVTGKAESEKKLQRITIGEQRKGEDYAARFREIFEEVVSSDEHKDQNHITVTPFNLDGHPSETRKAMATALTAEAHQVLWYQENTEGTEQAIEDKITVWLAPDGTVTVNRFIYQRQRLGPDSFTTAFEPVLRFRNSTDPDDIAQAMRVLKYITGRDTKTNTAPITIGMPHEPGAEIQEMQPHTKFTNVPHLKNRREYVHALIRLDNLKNKDPLGSIQHTNPKIEKLRAQIKIYKEGIRTIPDKDIRQQPFEEISSPDPLAERKTRLSQAWLAEYRKARAAAGVDTENPDVKEVETRMREYMASPDARSNSPTFQALLEEYRSARAAAGLDTDDPDVRALETRMREYVADPDESRKYRTFATWLGVYQRSKRRRERFEGTFVGDVLLPLRDARMLHEYMSRIVGDHMTAIRAVKNQAFLGKISEENGYRIFPYNEGMQVIAWKTTKGNLILSSYIPFLRPDNNNDDEILVQLSSEQSPAKLAHEYPYVRVSQGENTDTSIQLAWDTDVPVSTRLDAAFADDYPELARLIQITHLLGDKDNVDNYEIEMNVSEEVPPSDSSPDGLPYNVSLTIRQRDNEVIVSKSKEQDLERKIKVAKAKRMIISTNPHAPSSRQRINDYINDMERQLAEMRSGIHEVTYQFNPEINQFEGTAHNTSLIAEPIPAETFMSICDALFSVVPTETVETSNPFHEPIVILAQPDKGRQKHEGTGGSTDTHSMDAEEEN